MSTRNGSTNGTRGYAADESIDSPVQLLEAGAFPGPPALPGGTLLV